MNTVLVEVRDLRWIANTIHVAYHNPPEGTGGPWEFCRKSTCDFFRQLIMRATSDEVKKDGHHG